MARSFGKKNVVSKNIFDYNIMLLGEAGVGKTTTIADVMRKFCNDNQYLMLQIGKEDGCKAISGLMWDSVRTWKEFTSFVDEVVKNRDDWGELKCVVVDTIDQLIDICTPQVLKEWNVSNMGKKDFAPAKTLNQAWGGFGKADEYMMSLILDQMWKLKSVGVSVFTIGHTRRRDVVDPVSGLTYSTMSAAIPLKDFDALKTKMDIVAIAYVDREMTSREFGRENIVTKKKSTINEVSNEVRKIAFRSSAYVLDSKSRFPDIVEEVPMNASAFVKAIQDAIDAAAGETSPSTSKLAQQPTEDTLADHVTVTKDEADELHKAGAVLLDDEDNEPPFDVDESDDLEDMEDEAPFDVESAKTRLRDLFKAGTAAQKKAVKEIRGDKTLAQINDQATIEKMLAVFDE